MWEREIFGRDENWALAEAAWREAMRRAEEVHRVRGSSTAPCLPKRRIWLLWSLSFLLRRFR